MHAIDKLNIKHLFALLSLTLLLIAVSPKDGYATHLIGGNLGYVDLGPDPNVQGNRLYLIVMETYMDCNSPSWGTAFPEPSIDIGFYEGVFGQVSSMNTLGELTLNLVDSNIVDPNLPPICDSTNLIGNTCVYLVRYQNTLSLPVSNLGYWILYERCCRPGGITNLFNSGDQGFAYSTWIPADTSGIITNTTAQFTDTLVSYICRTDTAYIVNAAVDPDGDSLVYSLVEPFRGVLGAGTPPPIASYFSTWLDPYTLPPPPVSWASGYSATNIFGSGGFQSIDSQTGLTKFVTMQSGVFVASIEILEYRNNVLVGITRRNIQLIADDCPNNNSPNQDTTTLDSSAVNPTTYLVQEGDSFCFDLNYQDMDGDPLLFTASGDIFDPNLTNPAATVTSPVQGIATVTGTICWNTGCGQGSTTPYTFEAVVVDSNCPPLFLIQTINIIVEPFVGPTTILGDSLVCLGQGNNTYSVPMIQGASYVWSTTGGTILSGNGTNTVVVNWTGASGQISVLVTSEFGCSDGLIAKSIIISNVVADAGPDKAICLGDAVQIGGSPTSPDPNLALLWSPATGLNNPSLSNPMASPTVTTNYIVSLSDTLGCVGTDTMTLTVNTLMPSGLDPNNYLCPGDTLQLTAQGTSFLWSPNTFISNTTIANPMFWPPANAIYTLDYTDINGCTGSDTIAIQVDGQVPTNAGPDANLCIGDTLMIGGSPTAPTGTTYLWTPNTNLSDDTIANPLAFPPALGTYIYTVNTTSDTCHGIDSVTITVIPLPVITTSNDTLICQFDTTMIQAFGTGTFAWDNGATLSDTAISNPLAFPSTSTLYTVTLTDANGCENSGSVQVDIQNLPVVDAGGGFFKCKYDNTTIGGSPTGPTGSTYLWTPSTGLNDPTLANPIWSYFEDISYSVQVTDSIGCVSSDSVSILVFRLGSISDDTTVCKGVSVQLTTSTIHPSVFGPTYTWTPGAGLNFDTVANPIASPDTTTTYTVIVQDYINCLDTGVVTVSIFDSSVPDFKLTGIPACSAIEFTVENNSQNASDYIWLLNDVEFSREENPTFTVPYSSGSVLTLITSSIDGCSDTTETQLSSGTFDDMVELEIPNVFTPNGDGINDFFEINTNGNINECISVRVFNRSGGLIFESTGGINVWNGRTFSGQEVPDGTYFYLFSINGVDYKGTVMVLR